MLRRVALAFAALAGLGCGVLFLTYPLLPAALCPACFGLAHIGEDVLAEAQSPAQWQADILDLRAKAQAHVDAELGAVDLRRRVVFCHSEACAQRLGARGAFGLTISTPIGAVVYLAPGGATPNILRHELAHVTIHARAGLRATLNGTLPAWLDEGLAVVISDDPSHLRAGKGIARCAAPPVALVANPFDFARHAAQDRGLYTRAACAALHLEAQLGGRAGLLSALDDLSRGKALPELHLP